MKMQSIFLIKQMSRVGKDLLISRDMERSLIVHKTTPGTSVIRYAHITLVLLKIMPFAVF